MSKIKYDATLGDLDMPDEILERALKRERELKVELEEIQTFIRVYGRFRVDGFVQPCDITTTITRNDRDTDLESMPPSAILNLEAPKHSRRTRSTSSKNAVIEAAKRILQNRTNPVKNSEITRMILSEGVNIKSDNKERYVSTLLSHCKDFRTAGRRVGWLLIDESLHDAEPLHDAESLRYNSIHGFIDAPDAGEQPIDKNDEQ